MTPTKPGTLREAMDASDDTAEVLRDLYRREEQRSRAGLARSWAFDRAVKAGTGCYRIDALQRMNILNKD